jgi:hypothetical protein
LGVGHVRSHSGRCAFLQSIFQQTSLNFFVWCVSFGELARLNLSEQGWVNKPAWRLRLQFDSLFTKGNHTMSSQIKSAIAMASAAAALFAVGASVATSAQAADNMSVKCAGLNSCKGHSDCKTAKNECKGMNSCKGQGWNMKASAKDCTSAGGTVLK